MRELFHEIGSSLRQNKLRTALTGFAVSWGIFLLITLLGTSNGLMNSFTGNMDQYVSQGITVEGWRTSKPYAGYKENRLIQLDTKDFDYTQSKDWEGRIQNVITSTSGSSVILTLGNLSVEGWMEGKMPQHLEQEKLQMSAGRYINQEDIDAARKVMVLSLAHAKELSPKDPEAIIGKWVSAGKIAFRIVGIYHTDEQNWRRSCPIPYTTYKRIYDPTDKVEAISLGRRPFRSTRPSRRNMPVPSNAATALPRMTSAASGSITTIRKTCKCPTPAASSRLPCGFWACSPS